LNEKQLIQDCLNGKPEAQKRLYNSFAPQMLGVCYRYAQSKEEAEDFLQEAFMVIFRKLEQYRGDGSLAGWIRRTVVNTSLNALKAKHRLTEKINIIPIEQAPDYGVAQTIDSGNELIELVRQLPMGYRTVFNLYAIEGYSHEEIATMLDIKASTSRSQYTRAREILMKKLSTETTNIKVDERYG
jgi:RNA polymerase sigma-70 factor (ECF subfamily)